MLELALNHIDELKRKFHNTWFDEKYMFYHEESFFDDIKISDDTWDKHQFVSLDKDGEIVGFIGYEINRQTYSCHSLNIINFSDKKAVFGMDLGQALVDIFERFNFRKLTFSVIVGNPIEASYDKMVDKYGGRVVGIFKEDTKLMDGNLYDEKFYEIMSEDYFRSKEKKDEEVIH